MHSNRNPRRTAGLAYRDTSINSETVVPEDAAARDPGGVPSSVTSAVQSSQAAAKPNFYSDKLPIWSNTPPQLLTKDGAARLQSYGYFFTTIFGTGLASSGLGVYLLSKGYGFWTSVGGGTALNWLILNNFPGWADQFFGHTLGWEPPGIH